MEDEGFVDDEFIQEVAGDYAARYGLHGITMLRERAEIAAASGDYLLAQTWREMAETAALLLGLHPE